MNTMTFAFPSVRWFRLLHLTNGAKPAAAIPTTAGNRDFIAVVVFSAIGLVVSLALLLTCVTMREVGF